MTVIWFTFNHLACLWLFLLTLPPLLSADPPPLLLHSLPLHSLCKSSLIHSQKHPGYMQPSCSVTMDICSRLTSCAPLSIAFSLAVFMAFAFRLFPFGLLGSFSSPSSGDLWYKLNFQPMKYECLTFSCLFLVSLSCRKRRGGRPCGAESWLHSWEWHRCLCRTIVVCFSSKR